MTRVYHRESIADRFWRYVSPEPNSGCWLWTTQHDKDGYGRLGRSPWEGGRETIAHRLAWTLLVGPVPGGLWVLHHCDNPTCVNPEHLFLGSPLDNVADMVSKGRKAITRFSGEAHPRAKVSAAEVSDIRRRRRAGEGVRALAREYGLHHTSVLSMLRGKTWPVVEGGPSASP
jgi:HNH endonuclease